MPRKRIYHTMRIETIESKIAFFEAQGNHEAAQGIRYLCESAPLNDENIETERAKYKAAFDRWNRGESLLD